MQRMANRQESFHGKSNNGKYGDISTSEIQFLIVAISKKGIYTDASEIKARILQNGMPKRSGYWCQYKNTSVGSPG